MERFDDNSLEPANQGDARKYRSHKMLLVQGLKRPIPQKAFASTQHGEKERSMPNKRSRGEVRNSKLQKVAADLFLKHGYEGVSIDNIVELAGGSKSTVYSEFGGKCGLFVRSIENLCREANKPLAKIDYTGLNLEASLKKLSFQIVKLITAKRSVALHRLAIGEALNCPEVGEAWYTHGPAKTASFIRSLLESRREELRETTIPIDRIAVILHDSLTGDVLYRRLAGVGRHENDTELERMAGAAVDLIFGVSR
jgi:AcrR family transcriptional regulator